jgi:hypothetical protein
MMSIKGGNDSINDDEFSHSEAAEELLDSGGNPSPDIKVHLEI